MPFPFQVMSSAYPFLVTQVQSAPTLGRCHCQLCAKLGTRSVIKRYSRGVRGYLVHMQEKQTLNCYILCICSHIKRKCFICLQELVSEGPVPWVSKNSVTFVAEQVSHHPPSKLQSSSAACTYTPVMKSFASGATSPPHTLLCVTSLYLE